MLAVCGGKGGCGKTTTTLGLARTLARRGRQVLAVDADRDMPDLAAMAGVPARPTVGELSGGSVDADGAGTGSGADGLAALARPLPDRPRAAVCSSAPGDDRRALRQALDRAGCVAAATLVDCPAGGGPAAATPIRAADRALVVTSPEPASLRDAAKTAALARAVGTPVAAVALTRAETVHEGVGRLLGADVTPLPPASTPLTDDAVATARRRLADELW